MNSFASIIFTLLFLIKGLFPNMDLCCELQKVPNLMEHYAEHKELNGSSFLQFLSDHYVNLEGNSKEGEDPFHDKLPFHGNAHCCHPSFFYAPQQHFAWIDVELVHDVKFIHHSTSHHSESLESPFQPPKV